MKLISLEITPAGLDGWTSGKLVFGEHITQLFSPNGAGKTPVIQSIAFALGYPISFREDIKSRCEYVVLACAVKDRRLVIRRRLDSTFIAEVLEDGKEPLSYANEQEFSRFMLELWGIKDPVLMTVGGGASKLYISHIIPLFFLDQDHGYSNVYYPASKFIKDQYAEVMRVVFGVSPKNAFDQKRARVSVKDKLDRLDAGISRREALMKDLMEDVPKPRRTVSDMNGELQRAKSSLDELKLGGSARDENQIALDAEIRAIKQRRVVLLVEDADLKLRIKSLTSIKNEIEVEADTLLLNEEARRVFSSFNNICSNQSCGLFLRSSESYGKSLLYLRDQIKDLERSQLGYELRLSQVSKSLGDLSSLLTQKAELRNSLADSSESENLVESAARLTELIINLRRDLQLEQQLAEEEAEYVADLTARSNALDELASLSRSDGQVDIALVRVRNSLLDRFMHWLRVLHAVNIPRDTAIDGDFDLDFHKENLKSFKGSTLTRIVLAMRTAVFDLLVESPEFSPRFLILDTPRQQDIQREDLARYMEALKEVARGRGIQIIFSSSNYRYEVGDKDVEWLPWFPGEEQEMYLGIPSIE